MLLNVGKGVKEGYDSKTSCEILFVDEVTRRTHKFIKHYDNSTYKKAVDPTAFQLFILLF